MTRPGEVWRITGVDAAHGTAAIRRLEAAVLANHGDPAAHHALARACMESGYFDRARRCLRAAMSLGDAWLRLPQFGNDLERLRLYPEAWRALAAAGNARMISSGTGQPVRIAVREWDGASLAGKTMLIERRIRHMGAELRVARLIGKVCAEAARCVVRTEDRLVPILRRSFPEAVVVSAMNRLTDVPAADVAASYETLALHYCPDDMAIRRSFVPLRVDSGAVARYRDRYLSGGEKRLIGISWRSTNAAKEVPALVAWLPLLARPDCRFVSLQYGDVKAEIDAATAASGVTLIHDPTVDQLIDMDRFAAQVAAMDAVVTISVTGAHLAGALGVPTTILLDDKPHLAWPVEGEESPWYPQTRLVRQSGKPWREVIASLAATFD